MPSWLAGVAMSTTSVAVVYAVMIEFGFNTTDYGKTVSWLLASSPTSGPLWRLASSLRRSQ